MITPTRILTHGALAASLLVGMTAVFLPEAALAQTRRSQPGTEAVRRPPVVRPQTGATVPKGPAEPGADTASAGAPRSQGGALPTTAQNRSDQKLDQILRLLSMIGDHATVHRAQHGGPGQATISPNGEPEPTRGNETANPAASRRSPPFETVPHPTPLTTGRTRRP